MNRAQLEHVIRASAAIAGDDEIIVIGSQAILGQFPTPPPELCVSVEADVYPKNKPEYADLIDGSIGELPPFHSTFGYYAQGVAPETAILPTGWEARLVPVRNANTRGGTGWCLEVISSSAQSLLHTDSSIATSYCGACRRCLSMKRSASSSRSGSGSCRRASYTYRRQLCGSYRSRGTRRAWRTP